jgi:hypothetical protein
MTRAQLSAQRDRKPLRHSLYNGEQRGERAGKLNEHLT